MTDRTPQVKSPPNCEVDHQDATCTRCDAEHVVVGWAHLCRDCWNASNEVPDLYFFVEPF